MEVLDPGHVYRLTSLDEDRCSFLRKVWRKLRGKWYVLAFVKREGPGYPGNIGSHPGTTIQEVMRALIDRLEYLDGQIPCPCNDTIIGDLRYAISLLEQRAAIRHNRPVPHMLGVEIPIEKQPVCVTCGHIGCTGTCHG